MIAVVIKMLASLGLLAVRMKAGFIALMIFLWSAISSVIAWVISHWSRSLLIRVAVFAVWVALITVACNALNSLVGSLLSWTMQQSKTIQALNSSGSWLQGLLFEGVCLGYLWNTLVDCFGFWLGCHTFRALYYKYIWAKTFTLVGMR